MFLRGQGFNAENRGLPLWWLAALAITLIASAALVLSTFQPRVIVDEWIGMVEGKRLGRVIEGEQTYWLTVTRADEKRADVQVEVSIYNAVRISTVVRVRQLKAGILPPWYEIEIIEY